MIPSARLQSYFKDEKDNCFLAVSLSRKGYPNETRNLIQEKSLCCRY
jgi:hypothetical protein